MNTKKPRPLLRTKPGKIGTGKLDKNAVVRHESHLEVPGNEEQSKSATKWWEDKWGQDLRYEASILTYLKFLYFVVYVLTCDKGKEWVAMPSWNFAWAWRCQGAKELVFVLLTNDHLPGCVSFVKLIDLSNGQETFCLFDCGHWYCIPITSPSFFSKCQDSLTKGMQNKNRSFIQKSQAYQLITNLLLTAFHG